MFLIRRPIQTPIRSHVRRYELAPPPVASCYAVSFPFRLAAPARRARTSRQQVTGMPLRFAAVLSATTAESLSPLPVFYSVCHAMQGDHLGRHWHRPSVPLLTVSPRAARCTPILQCRVLELDAFTNGKSVFRLEAVKSCETRCAEARTEGHQATCVACDSG